MTIPVKIGNVDCVENPSSGARVEKVGSDVSTLAVVETVMSDVPVPGVVSL